MGQIEILLVETDIASVEIVVWNLIVLNSLLIFFERSLHVTLMVKSETEVLVVEGEVFPAATVVVFDLLDFEVNGTFVRLKCIIEQLAFKVGKAQVVVVGWLTRHQLGSGFQIEN